MAIILKCPQCREDIGISESSAGKRVQCPLCNCEFIAPSQEAEPAAPAARSSKAVVRSKKAAAQKPARSPKPQRKPAPAPSRRLQSSELREEYNEQVNQSRQIMAIALIVVFAGLGTWGIFTLVNLFSQRGASSPAELIANARVAATIANSEPNQARKLLWQVLTPEERIIAQNRRGELEKYLEQWYNREALQTLDTAGLWLTCLASEGFRADRWKYRDVDHNRGLVMFDDGFGNTAELQSIGSINGWRAGLISFCLDRIAALSEKK